MTSLKKTSKKNSSKNINLFSDFYYQTQKSKKCNIKDKIGLITPKDIDFFSSNSKQNSKTEPRNNKDVIAKNNQDKKIIKINIVSSSNENDISLNPFDFSSYSISDQENKEPNIPQFKATQEYYREINQDSIESIIPCKPMLNSTSSKAYMKEYSKSKRYQEDKLYFFSTTDTVEEQALNPLPHKLIFTSTETKSPILEDMEDTDENMEIEDLIKFQESNLPVPIKKKDDENFKILTMRKMKRKTMPPNKSVRKFAEDIEPLYEKEFRIQNNYCHLLKRKVVHSLRRIYSSNFVLKKGKKEFNFMIFTDKDIGIYEYWQAHIHEAQNDEDFDTDEEQKKLAMCFTLGEVKEALVYVRDKCFEDCFVNFNRFNKFRTEEENDYIKDQMLKLQRNMKL
jgi:hypothetical protein